MTGPGAVVFDTDGVLLDSASLHATAWKSAFDSCLDSWAASGEGIRQRPFDADGEYRELVDGKPRYDGAFTWLRARAIDLPPGDPGDAPGCGTVWAVAARKEQAFSRLLDGGAVEAFVDTAPALRALRAQGVRCAAASASRHARPLLEAAGLLSLFDAVVDGTDAARLGLAGKPDPALFLEAAARLGVDPQDAAVVEDALAGVEAGRRGGFRLVVGIERSGNPDAAKALVARGADAVAADLLEVAGQVCGARP
ncbi:HAD-IA family hydrolase [Streptomyces sp. H27-H1]|uniref:HAD family hydrolase n=1 Tax=Streptomyces sp. H27-H1 TaxID=2996461 RepID=UPI00226DE32B|nr:HAD-IA family hydrolase [Streptomyces sp. H27-H1]MCY0927992.1 HAD-IA family hydrolase [Streptomyces sp. H27-H1]